MSEYRSWEDVGVEAKTNQEPALYVPVPPKPPTRASERPLRTIDPASWPSKGGVPNFALPDPVSGVKFRGDIGTVAQPTYGFVQGPQGGLHPNESTGDGMFQPAVNKIGWALGGTEFMRLVSPGLGIRQVPLSTLDVEGSLGMAVWNITTGGPTVATMDENVFAVYADVSGGALTCNLPAASACTGRIYNVKKIDSSAITVTIDAAGADLIDGTGTKIIVAQYVSITIQSDGVSNWWII